MDNNILVALVSGLCVAIPSVIATIATISKNNAIQDEKLKVISEALAKISDKVDIYGIDIPKMKVEIEHLKKEVDELKRR